MATEAYKAKRGWTFPWYSSYGSDFNYDFHVTLDESVAPIVYNYRTKAEHGTYCFLDMAALGRQEDWEEPKGRSAKARGPSPDLSA